jgi:hypothetical protein
MLKQTVRFACLALLLFAASAPPLTANATSSIQFEGPEPYPVPPTSCMPMPCQVGLAR